MGAAASTQLSSTLEERGLDLDNEMLTFLTKVLAQEYTSLQTQGLSGLELEQKFGDVLRHQQVRLGEQLADKAKEARPAMIRKMSSLSTFDKPDEFSKACLANVEAVRNRGSMNYLICCDGSDASYIGVQNIIHLRRKNDTVCGFHTFRPDAEEKEAFKEHPNFNRDNIAERLEVTMITSGVPVKNFAVSMRARGNDESVRDALTQMLTEYELRDRSRATLHSIVNGGIFDLPSLPTPDFVVIGHVGRKGLSKHNNELTSLGGSADLTLQSICKPCILMKKLVAGNTSTLFCVAVSASEASKIGLDIVLAILKPRDRLKVVFIAGATDTDELINQLRASYENDMLALGLAAGEFVVLPQVDGRSVDAVLVDWLHEVECDYLAITPRVKVEVERSRLTVPILLNSPCNVILCKA